MGQTIHAIRMETVTVGDVDVPTLGLGTYTLRGEECERVVGEALSLGYRHIDTAEFYDNQASIGAAIEAADVPREELFVTTKIWQTNLEREDARRSALESLDELGINYVDLLLIHWPDESVPLAETIGAMNRLQSEGRVRHIGVSNFSISQLRTAMSVSETPILTNQVEYHPHRDRTDLREVCVDNDVVLTAYSPLAKGRVATDETLAAIGRTYDRSAAQVALRWLVQQENVVAIPKASRHEHLVANRAIFDFELTDEEMERIADLGTGVD
ncbi:aldo/keto reductase [Halanaeroarchaeum sulfurireducens]|uniref:Aldo/keto reductase n=2 Tax=Halanaeroarchaeum sulfurireducens TaxID=1604004 RepID=A0A0F7PC49_9EURY|nr:aldo/keto reductase [Halanaeroarchaeum sulfurireducens]ALG81344.1 aldo/keto reductase [Halanaeroarchaeum sulfurireducens]